MSDHYDDLIEEIEHDPEFWAEMLISEFTRELSRTMYNHGVNQSQLATRLGTSRAYTTRVLQGTANFTALTMAKLAHALDSKVSVHIAPKDARVKHFDVLDGGAAWQGIPYPSNHDQRTNDFESSSESNDAPPLEFRWVV